MRSLALVMVIDLVAFRDKGKGRGEAGRGLYHERSKEIGSYDEKTGHRGVQHPFQTWNRLDRQKRRVAPHSGARPTSLGFYSHQYPCEVGERR